MIQFSILPMLTELIEKEKKNKTGLYGHICRSTGVHFFLFSFVFWYIFLLAGPGRHVAYVHMVDKPTVLWIWYVINNIGNLWIIFSQYRICVHFLTAEIAWRHRTNFFYFSTIFLYAVFALFGLKRTVSNLFCLLHSLRHTISEFFARLEVKKSGEAEKKTLAASHNHVLLFNFFFLLCAAFFFSLVVWRK